MDIPFFVLLIPYAIGLIIFLIWVLFNIWHMNRFALFDVTGKLNTLAFLFFSGLILLVTWFLLKDIPWLSTIHLETDWISGLSAPGKTSANF